MWLLYYAKPLESKNENFNAKISCSFFLFKYSDNRLGTTELQVKHLGEHVGATCHWILTKPYLT